MSLPRQNITNLTIELATKALRGYYCKWLGEEVKFCPSEFMARSIVGVDPEEDFQEGWDETFMDNAQLYEYALMVLRVNDYRYSTDKSIKGNLNYKKLRLGLMMLWRHYVKLEAMHEATRAIRALREGSVSEGSE